MVLRSKVFAIIFLVLGIFPVSAFAGSADIALVNGRIITADANFSIRQAVAVRGERIFSLGDNSGIKQLIGSSVKTIDLKGKTLTKKRMADFDRAGVTSLLEPGGGGVRDAADALIKEGGVPLGDMKSREPLYLFEYSSVTIPSFGDEKSNLAARIG